MDFFFRLGDPSSGCLSLSFPRFFCRSHQGWVILGCVIGMKFILLPFEHVLLMTCYARRPGRSACMHPFGLDRQAGHRLGGPCRIRRFRLLCVQLGFMPWLGLTVCIFRDQKLVLGRTDNWLSCHDGAWVSVLVCLQVIREYWYVVGP